MVILILRILDLDIHILIVDLHGHGLRTGKHTVELLSDLYRGEALGGRLDRIDMELDERCRILERGVNGGNILPLTKLVNDLIGGLLQLVIVRRGDDRRVGIVRSRHRRHHTVGLHGDDRVLRAIEGLPPFVRLFLRGHAAVLLQVRRHTVAATAHHGHHARAAGAHHIVLGVWIGSDHGLDVLKDLIYLLDFETWLRRNRDIDLALIGLRHHLHTDLGCQKEGQNQETDGREKHHLLMPKQLLHDPAIATLHAADCLIGRCLRVLLRLIEDEAERYDGNRRNQRGDHTEHDGEAERCKELSRQTRHEAERQEYDAGRDGRSENGFSDRLYGLDCCAAPRLHTDRHILIHRTEAGLQDDDRVIDHHADAEHQRRHRDHVEGVAHRPHRDEGRQDRDRDGGTDDEGCLSVTEEDEDDDHRDDDGGDHGLENG